MYSFQDDWYSSSTLPSRGSKARERATAASLATDLRGQISAPISNYGTLSRSWFTSYKRSSVSRMTRMPSLTELMTHQTGEGLEKPSIPAPRPPGPDTEDHYAIPPSQQNRLSTLNEVSGNWERLIRTRRHGNCVTNFLNTNHQIN